MNDIAKLNSREYPFSPTSMNKAGEQILLQRISALEWLLENRIEQVCKLKTALERIRDCDWVITLPDRMDAVRAIAREALE